MFYYFLLGFFIPPAVGSLDSFSRTASLVLPVWMCSIYCTAVSKWEKTHLMKEKLIFPIRNCCAVYATALRGVSDLGLCSAFPRIRDAHTRGQLDPFSKKQLGYSHPQIAAGVISARTARRRPRRPMTCSQISSQ